MIPTRMPAKLAWINETAVHDVTDIVGQGIVRDRRARLKLPSSQDAVSVLILVFCGVLVLYPMGLPGHLLGECRRPADLSAG